MDMIIGTLNSQQLYIEHSLGVTSIIDLFIDKTINKHCSEPPIPQTKLFFI